MPVWRVAEEHLNAAIASVTAQSYRNWELIALNDASPDPHVGRVLAEASRSDPRIRVLTGRSNAGVGAASNEILRHARGQFLAFLDHDDLLHPLALELVGRLLSLRPDVDWVFTDEDKVNEGGRHFEPCLKPGWSRHLLLSFNYVAHLRVIRKEMIEKVGGHRPGFDGAQDYDLALRILASGGRFAHLPGILYHWRTVRASMAMAANAKPAAHQRALQALSEHAATFPQGSVPAARVLLPAASFFEVRRPCQNDVGVAVVDCFGNARDWVALLGRPVEIVDSDGNLPPEALVALARRAVADFLVVAPKGGLGARALDELLALLQVPGTALAAGRWLNRDRVEASGWVATERGELWDPWRLLAKRDPGYLNLAMVPGPRLVPPPRGFATNRRALIEAWERASDVAPAWRLPTGWARLGLEVVTAPRVDLRIGGPFAGPPGPPPPGLPSIRLSWLTELGLVEETSR
ncbi:MAG: glycosyltransferase [Acidobacteriia bacterium]|nr:glycosyltransferase [Terriglobia bacterium]